MVIVGVEIEVGKICLQERGRRVEEDRFHVMERDSCLMSIHCVHLPYIHYVSTGWTVNDGKIVVAKL